MIYRIMPEDYKDPSPVKGDVFPDVAADRWSALSIETLAEQDILIGYEDGTFRPEDYITRAEASAVIARYLGLEDATEANNLTDIQDTGPKAISMPWLKISLSRVMRIRPSARITISQELRRSRY